VLRNRALQIDIYLLTCLLVASQANSAFHPSGVGKRIPASAAKEQAEFIPLADERALGVQVLWDTLRTRVPYLSEVCSRGAIQIHVYLYLSNISDFNPAEEYWQC